MQLTVNGSNSIEQARKHNALTQLEKGDVGVLEFLAELSRDYPKSQTKLLKNKVLIKRMCK